MFINKFSSQHPQYSVLYQCCVISRITFLAQKYTRNSQKTFVLCALWLSEHFTSCQILGCSHAQSAAAHHLHQPHPATWPQSHLPTYHKLPQYVAQFVGLLVSWHSLLMLVLESVLADGQQSTAHLQPTRNICAT